MPGSVGFIFLALPDSIPWGFFLVGVLLNLGSAAPNYSRKPSMRSSNLVIEGSSLIILYVPHVHSI
jgi:hypothetical protein